MPAENQPAIDLSLCPATGDVCPIRIKLIKELAQVEQTLEYIRELPIRKEGERFEYEDGTNSSGEHSSLVGEEQKLNALLAAEGDCKPLSLVCAVGNRAIELAVHPSKIFEFIKK